jgi:glucose/arabinose dehydrogenase
MNHVVTSHAFRWASLSHAPVLAVALSAGLGASPSSAFAGDPIFDPIPEPILPGNFHVKLQTVATGLTAPLWGIDAPGQPDALFIVDQAGMLWKLNLTNGQLNEFLDLTPRLVALGIGGRGTYDERGFLGMAFHPGYATNGLFYTFTSEPADQPADFTTLGRGERPDHHDVITEWHVPNPTDPGSLPDRGSARELFRNDHPQFNHNGGAMQFGPDGMLYISIGDGGAGDDEGPGHAPEGNGQNIDTILGKILRIDPLGSDSANGQYGIPAGNPFAGAIPGLGEIFAYGFRNPYRMSFESGGEQELYVCDVGQNQIEEMNVVELGGNYGWRVKEGTFLFDANGEENGFVFADSPGVPANMVDPVAQYDHSEGIAIIGGFVYEGGKIPALDGLFVFGEHLSPFAGGSGRLLHVPDDGGTIEEFNLIGQKSMGVYLLGFGRDAHGEIYAMGNTTEAPFKNTGVVMRIVPLLGDLNADGLVDGADLGQLLGAWDTTAPAADLNNDGNVDGADLGLLLGAWTG